MPAIINIIKAWLFLLAITTPHGYARPTDSQEALSSLPTRIFSGAWAGVTTILAFLGHYDDDDDCENLEDKDSTYIQVTAVGLGRTGSTSLAIALEELGYRVIHDDEHVELSDLYDSLEEDNITWDEFHVLAGNRGFNVSFKTDWEWAVEKPDMKIILTVRDNPEKYVNSWLAASKFIDILQLRPFCWMKHTAALMPSFESEYLMEPTGGHPEKYRDRDTLHRVYEEYNQRIRDNVPKERLLEFNVKQGWGPLCRFLNKPIPEGIPFPHVHDRAKLLGEHFVLELATWIWPLAILLPMAIIIWAVSAIKKIGDIFIQMLY